LESGSKVGLCDTLIYKTFKICKLVATLSAGLMLEIPNHVFNIFATNNLSHGLIAHVAEYVQELQTLKGVRVDQIRRMATEITRLWCLLDVGEDAWQEFLRAHLRLSTAAIESCAKEIGHLVGLCAPRLPALIRERDVWIDRLLSMLHLLRPREERGGDFQATFDRNEEKLKYRASHSGLASEDLCGRTLG
jgi:hypothetical protein